MNGTCILHIPARASLKQLIGMRSGQIACVPWTRERLYRQIFSDEVWAKGGAHTVSFVTVKEDNSDRFWPENLQHKYSKLPAQMFWGTLISTRKGTFVLFEKEWGSVNSEVYNTHALSLVQEYCAQNPGYIFMQYNAPSHRSIETRINLLDRGYTGFLGLDTRLI